jgi:hypothetical protein
MSNYGLQTLKKQPSESRVYDMDFAANMVAGETVTAVSSVVVDPVGLTIGTAVFSGQRIQFRLSAGTAGITYKITVVVATSAGNTLEGDGLLRVENK